MSNLVYKVRGVDPAHGETFTVYVRAFSPINARWVALTPLKEAGWKGGKMEVEFQFTLERATKDE
jgi:hypothetical protein